MSIRAQRIANIGNVGFCYGAATSFMNLRKPHRRLVFDIAASRSREIGFELSRETRYWPNEVYSPDNRMIQDEFWDLTRMVTSKNDLVLVQIGMHGAIMERFTKEHHPGFHDHFEKQYARGGVYRRKICDIWSRLGTRLPGWKDAQIVAADAEVLRFLQEFNPPGLPN